MLESRRVMNGDLSFVKKMGGTSTDEGRAIVTDAVGNIYTTGRFQGTADFDPGPGTFNLISATEPAVFISKLDSNGDFAWAKSFAGTDDAYGNGIALDGQGNVYTIGQFLGTVDFDPDGGVFNLTSSGSFDVFISKLDNEGNFIWAKSFGGATNHDIGLGIAADEQGNVYSTGYFNDTADFDPGNGIVNFTSAGSTDVFISKLDGAGDFVWARRFGGTFGDAAGGIALDDFGNLVTTGYFVGSVDFDAGAGISNLSSAGEEDIFVSVWDVSGSFNWARALGGTGNDKGNSIAVDGEGNIYTAGRFSLTADFDPGAGTFSLTSAGNQDVFISKLDSTGNFIWAKSMGGTSGDDAYGITVDKLGNVYTVGTFTNTADFDSSAAVFNRTSAGGLDAFVSRLDTTGSFVWAKAMGGASTDFGRGVAVDDLGNVFTTGHFQLTADFDPGPAALNLTSDGEYDVFISKLTQDLVVTAPTSGAANWVLRRAGAHIQVFNKQTNTIVTQRPYSKTLGVHIQGAASSTDSVTLDFQFGGLYSFPNGIRFDGNSGNDVITVRGSATESVIYRPASALAGASTFDVSGSQIALSNVESVVVSNVSSMTIETPNTNDVLTVSPATGYGNTVASMISGTSSTVAISPLTWSQVRNVTVDTGANDGISASTANDTVTFVAGSLDSVGMRNLTVDTGKGNDTLTINNLGDLGLPLAGGVFQFVGGAGVDRIAVSGDADFRISDMQLLSSLGGKVLIDAVERATMTGGNGNNLLSAVGFSGAVILNGGNGNDILHGAAGNDTLFGGNGNDWLYGNDGDDLLDGGANDDWLYGGYGHDNLLGGTGNDILSGQAGNDSLNGQAGVDLYQFEGTNNSESLSLQFLTATTSRFVRKPRGLSTTLEADSITNDASDEVSVEALGGDDVITIDLAITMLGVVDGGDGTDSCTAPASWTKISC
jgi:Ca2+-binding RTX toxin-like protein